MKLTLGFASISLALILTLYGAGLLTIAAPALLGHLPPALQSCPVQCLKYAPTLSLNRPLRIMSWNIQFLAGSYYPFWSEPDREPPLLESDLEKNLKRIVNVIREVNPDILQLQEVHLTHPVSFHQNQLQMLLHHLSDIFPCYTYGSYWKARLIPQKKMMGEIDMALVTMSRFQIDEAFLRLLPSTRTRRVVIPFYPRHSMMEVRFLLEQGGSLTAINTHLDAPTLERGDMTLQTEAVFHRLNRLTHKRRLWFVSGDFNLIPPGLYPHLPENQKPHYYEKSRLAPFYKKFHAVPSLEDISSPNRPLWLTAYDLNKDALDLIVDYIFTPEYIKPTHSRVLHLPLDISDHMPLVTELILQSDRKASLARIE